MGKMIYIGDPNEINSKQKRIEKARRILDTEGAGMYNRIWATKALGCKVDVGDGEFCGEELVTCWAYYGERGACGIEGHRELAIQREIDNPYLPGKKAILKMIKETERPA